MRAWGAVFVAGAIAAGLVNGCGGGAAPAKSPGSMPQDTNTTNNEEAPPSGAAGAPGQAPYPAPTFAQPPPQPAPPAPPMSRDEQRVHARDALFRAQEELSLANARDCAAACRALGSMERATARICDLADSPDDRRVCDDAKKKLADAKQRIRKSCASCADGTKLD